MTTDPRKLRFLPRDQLPSSLWPVKSMPVGQYHPHELDVLAARPQTTRPLPEGLSEQERRQRSNLSQHKARTPEGNRRSMANLRRSIKGMPDEPAQPTPNVPAPQVPTALPTDPPEKILRNGRYMQLILSREEYDIYVETWNEYYGGDGAERFDHPEDRQDIHTVCLYTALEFRYLLAQQNNPSTEVHKQLESCRKILQKARENLAARRSDRIDQKNNNSSRNVTNIAVIAGRVPPDSSEQLKQLEAEEDDFFENMKTPRDLSKIAQGKQPVIDAEYEVKEKDADGDS